jgi:hypothetical protein
MGVEDVTVNLGAQACGTSCNPSSCTTTTTSSNKEGAYAFCSPCTTCSNYGIAPSKDDNPLNGVSTYDLVLISKHILGIQPLGSPYKMIAADANKNNSITTFDIVELRKLILGLYTVLPNNTSWRFVPKSYVFANPSNPFPGPSDPPIPEQLNCVTAPSNNHDFVGIKVGDVNNSVIPSSFAQNPTTSIQISKAVSIQGGIVTIPVIYTGLEKMEAVQMGLRFDPTKWALMGPSKGDLPNYSMDNFGLTNLDKGQIRTLWFPMMDNSIKIRPGEIMFYLSFKSLNNQETSGDILKLDNTVLENSAWNESGKQYDLYNTSETAERMPEESTETPSPLQVIARPNPTSGTVIFTIKNDKEIRGRLVLSGSFGNRISVQEVSLQPNEQEITVKDLENLPSGVYLWQVIAGQTKAQGRLIKQ